MQYGWCMGGVWPLYGRRMADACVTDVMVLRVVIRVVFFVDMHDHTFNIIAHTELYNCKILKAII